VIKKELPVDILEFFYLTPLPGSEDHRTLLTGGVPMDPDINKYDLNHCVTGHPRMSQAEWERTYRLAWETYYTPEHVETILRRALVTGASPGKAVFFILWFKGSIGIENVHPLESGIVRMKHRKTRRSGLPLESPFVFYPRFWAETAWKIGSWISLYVKLQLIYRRIKKDPHRMEYTDLAVTPVTDEEIGTRELFQSDAAQTYIVKLQRREKIRRGEAVS
jgi:hypothetical protein